MMLTSGSPMFDIDRRLVASARGRTTTNHRLAYSPRNRLTNMVDAVGTTAYSYTAGGELYTEDGPFASDTVTNTYVNRQRTKLVLGQPTGVWTNAFAYDEAARLTNVTSSAGAFG